MQKKKATITGTILAAILGGSVYMGSEINRPDCDYVIANQEQEICLTEEQAQAIIENFTAPKVGFGSIPFGGEAPIFNKKEK